MIQLKFTSKDDFYKRVRNINFFFVKEKVDENVDFDFVSKLL